MKRIYVVVVVSLLSVTIMCSCSKGTSKVNKRDLKSLADSASYAYGYLSGKQAKEQDKVHLNAQIFASAFVDGYAMDSNKIFSQDECVAILEKYSREQMEQEQKMDMQKAQPNIERSEKFLADNSQKDGVKTTDSGLQYKVIKQGKGVKPKSGQGDRIRFLYALSVLNKNGSEKIIHSDFTNPNATAQLIGVDNWFAGFTEAVTMMNKGSRYRIWVHPSLAFGLQDSPDIPAGSLVIMDIEVVDVIKNTEE